MNTSTGCEDSKCLSALPPFCIPAVPVSTRVSAPPPSMAVVRLISVGWWSWPGCRPTISSSVSLAEQPASRVADSSVSVSALRMTSVSVSVISFCVSVIRCLSVFLMFSIIISLIACQTKVNTSECCRGFCHVSLIAPLTDGGR